MDKSSLKIELNLLIGLVKNAGWELLVKKEFMRLKDLQRDIVTADISKLLSDTHYLAKHCEMIAEARAIIEIIEYPERKITEIQKSLGEIKEKGGIELDD